MSDPWWPGSSDDPSTAWPDPAFTVQRRVGAAVPGGDYVRGSETAGTLQQTAVRYSPIKEGEEELIRGKGLLFIRPFDYNTVEIRWNIPPDIYDTWVEMTIVRSSHGYPSTVNDGQTVFRKRKVDLWPDGYPEDAEGNPVVATSAVYDPYDPRISSPPVKQPEGYPPRTGLPSGRWYYYSLFFLTTKWTRSIVSSCLLPRNYGHQDHLWNNIPPYYRWIDENQRGGGAEGDLQRFLRIFGFELDTTREFVEQWQLVYNLDFSPTQLVRHLGANLGVPYESGIGDIRYRSYLARIGYLYRARGSTSCLQHVIEAVAKCVCEVEVSGNSMLLSDDSDFFQGTGNWGGLHPSTPPNAIASSATVICTPDKIYLTNSVAHINPPPNAGRGVMEFWTPAADATTDVILACGDGIIYDLTSDRTKPENQRVVIPRYTGIPVEPGNVYGFSIWMSGPAAINADAIVTWFDKWGQPTSLLSVVRGGIEGIGTPWEQRQVTATAPANAAYMVPMVYLDNRPAAAGGATVSPTVYFAGASFDLLGSAATIDVSAPDKYLRLGVDAMRMGDPTPTPPGGSGLPSPYKGYVIGEPPS